MRIAALKYPGKKKDAPSAGATSLPSAAPPAASPVKRPSLRGAVLSAAIPPRARPQKAGRGTSLKKRGQPALYLFGFTC